MQPDADLHNIQIFLDGDHRAIDSLVQKYYPELLNFLLRMGCQPSDADDIIQETFIKAARGIPDTKEPSAVRAWLFKVCHNNLRDHFKRAFRRREVPYDPGLLTYSKNLDGAAQESEMEATMRVQNALNQLPPKQRLVVVLYYYHGFPINEIARLARCPAGTVKSRMHNAIQRLQILIKEGDAE